MPQIVIDPNTLTSNDPGVATGTLWVAIGGTEFPAEGWNDFVVVILEAWASALLRLAQGASTTELVHFMDGPFELSMAATESGNIELVARERDGAERARSTVALATLAQNLSGSAEKILGACRERSIWSVDAERLKTACLSLRSLHSQR